jgi:trans-aconitate methyltransferase
MQTKQELEDWYAKPDQWGYFTNPEDEKRRTLLLSMLDCGYYYERALDVGCGEGYITEKIPAHTIHGLDLATNALARLPKNVIPVQKPHGQYDLVVSTGTLYAQYDHKAIYECIMDTAKEHILISGIGDWLIPYDFGNPLRTIKFPYREFEQHATLYVKR